MSFLKHFPPAAAALLGLVAAAHAQTDPFRMVDARLSNQPGLSTSVPLQTTSYRSGYLGYPGWNPWFNGGYFAGGAGDFLSGTADVINANGNYQIQQQDARLRFEDWQKARLETRRRTIEEWEWEQAHRPTWLDQRAQIEAANLQVARNDPPLADIYSGKSLNVLLRAIQKGQNSGLAGPPVSVDQELLKRVRLTDGQTGTGVGLLRDGGKLRWPVALAGSDFQKDRQKIDGLVQRATDQAAGSNGVDPGTIADLQGAVNNLDALLREKIQTDEITPTASVQGRRYVAELRDTIRLLQDPNVSAYLTGKRTPQGRTVQEVVKFVLDQGLTFAPATRGDEQAYAALYNALLAYDGGMLAAAGGPHGPPQR
jgi:hypothetical protein